ncbi:MAG: protein-glutamate O-methyltransferase CheR [Gemmatimonadaceae bacterium]
MSEQPSNAALPDPGVGDFNALTRKISAERGFGCASYKEKCLRRRIAVRMRARGVHTYEDYSRILESDEGEYDRLLDTLTINVTKLFRNWDVYASMSTNVIPVLWDRGTPIRVWSAGCSSGEEPHSLAVLFHRHAEANGQLNHLKRIDVLGTDIDRRCLADAVKGQFEAADFTDTPDDLRARYFTPTAPFTAIPSVRSIVRFERRDMLSDGPPPGQHDMIVCRNVLIYFDRDTQERLFETFYQALAPGGFLVLGKVETLIGDVRSKFVPIDARERIFRRP